MIRRRSWNSNGPVGANAPRRCLRSRKSPQRSSEGNGYMHCMYKTRAYNAFFFIYLMYIHTEMYVAAGDCCTCLILICRRFEVQWWCLFGTKSLAMMKTLMISAILGIVLTVLPFSVINLNSETQWRFPIPSRSKMTNRNDGILKWIHFAVSPGLDSQESAAGCPRNCWWCSSFERLAKSQRSFLVTVKRCHFCGRLKVPTSDPSLAEAWKAGRKQNSGSLGSKRSAVRPSLLGTWVFFWWWSCEDCDFQTLLCHIRFNYFRQ